jgi:hypothetical protein
MHGYRKDLPPLPKNMQSLPLDHRGYPIPWFVAWLKDGELSNQHVPGSMPDFRVIDSEKLQKCLHQPLCWICGKLLGVNRVFSIGPMCCINRVISEPPSHRSCAEYAVVACPFLSQPRMRRNEHELPGTPEQRTVAGVHIARNPGVTCLWQTNDYKPFRAGPGWLWKLGEPKRVNWYSEGRPATLAEVMEAMLSGYPTLLDMAKKEGAVAVEALEQNRKLAMRYLP